MYCIFWMIIFIIKSVRAAHIQKPVPETVTGCSNSHTKLIIKAYTYMHDKRETQQMVDS